MAKPKAKKPLPQRKPRVLIKKPPELPVAKPYVFQDCHHRTFLLLEEKTGHNRYLTVRDEEMQVIKLTHDLPPRDPSTGLLLSQETTSTTDLHPLLEKDGQPYALQKAAQKLFNSLIVRTYYATKELCLILGKPVPTIPEEVVQARKAAAERLVAAREQRRINLAEARSNKPQHNPTNDKGDSTMSTKKSSKKTVTKSVAKKAVSNKPIANGDQKITLLVKENPKRPGSQAHKTYPLYAKCKTVAEYLKAGGRRSDIAWDSAHKFIKLSA